jgi:hypothetical protein
MNIPTLLNTNAPQIGIKPTTFTFVIDRFPTTTFLIQDVSIPAISFGRATQETPFQDVHYPGEKIRYDDLEVEFVLDQNLQNYIEIHSWMRSLSMTGSREPYAEMIKRRSTTIHHHSGSRLPEETTNAVLTALNANKQTSFQFLFKDVFPIAMSRIDFSTQSDDMEFMKCNVTFSYNSFDVGLANSSAVSVSQNQTINPGTADKFKIYG